MIGTKSRSERCAWRAARQLAAFAFILLTVTGCVFVANPSRERVPAPPVALGAEDVSFPSASGSRIKAWLARGRTGAGAVLLLHGIGSNRSSMEARAKFLHDSGFTVLALDFEGHGE